MPYLEAGHQHRNSHVRTTRDGEVFGQMLSTETHRGVARLRSPQGAGGTQRRVTVRAVSHLSDLSSLEFLWKSQLARSTGRWTVPLPLMGGGIWALNVAGRHLAGTGPVQVAF